MGSQMAEPCDVCETDRTHEVKIELMAENTRREASAYAREPYRVATCLACGTTTQTRMNNA